jgi:hypothetical protein
MRSKGTYVGPDDLARERISHALTRAVYFVNESAGHGGVAQALFNASLAVHMLSELDREGKAREVALAMVNERSVG